MNNPKISVIIPTYNRGNLIQNTINSVLNQTFTDWELLVIDDGSTDNTKEIVQEFIKKDSRVKYFYEENSGCPSGPRNLGVENAKGEYVAFLDSDDEWFPTKLEKQLDIFTNSKNPKLGVVACYLYIKDNKTGKIVSKRDTYYMGNILNKLLMDTSLMFTSSCIMTKLSILKEVGPFDSRFKVSEDVDMWLRISELGYEFDYVPEYLLNYLVHGSNIYFGNKNFDGEKEFIVYIEKHLKLYLEHDSTVLGYYYYITKQYKQSRKYLTRVILQKDSNNRERIKSLGCLIITFLPFLEKTAKIAWKNIRHLFR